MVIGDVTTEAEVRMRQDHWPRKGWSLEAGTGKNVDSSYSLWKKHSPAKPV